MRHLPALDGLRGVAVLGVLFFHAELPMFRGGFLGVSTFFTLSGFLITALLLRDHDELGRLDLRRFWLRRLRRLMPAAFLALVGTAVYASVAIPADQLSKLRGDLLAALFYVANWHFMASGQTYADLSAGPSLLQHFWSLSIEEQFYLVFPLVALVALRFGGRRLFGQVIAALAVASVASSFLFDAHGTAAGADAGYFATNTRAVELLVGAWLAVWVTGRADRAPAAASVRNRRLEVANGWSIVGGLALLATVASWALVHVDDAQLIRGGLALHAAGVALILLAILREAETGGPLSRVLAAAPLRRLGQISYGVYLYHWPLFVVLDEERTGLRGYPLFLLRLSATFLLAGLSYALVEQPVRRHRLRTWRPALLALPAGAVALVGALVAVTIPSVPVAYGDARLQDFRPLVQSTPVAADAVVPSPAVSPPGSASNAARAVPPARSMVVIGDSALYGVGPALSAAVPSAGVRTMVDASYPGVALTDGFDWRREWRGLIDRYDPDVVVIMIGRWDQPFLRRNGQAAYQPLVEEAGRLLTSRGAHVLWLEPMLGPPVSGDNGEAAFRRLPGLLPGRVVGGDINPALRGPDGSWLTTVACRSGGSLPVRKPDHYHLCQAGAERVTGAILDRLTSLGWMAPSGARWRLGSWRQNARYVACPAPSG